MAVILLLESAYANQNGKVQFLFLLLFMACFFKRVEYLHFVFSL